MDFADRDDANYVNLTFHRELFQWCIRKKGLTFSWTRTPKKCYSRQDRKLMEWESFWWIWLIVTGTVFAILSANDFGDNSIFALCQCFRSCSSALNKGFYLSFQNIYAYFECMFFRKNNNLGFFFSLDADLMHFFLYTITRELLA